MNWIEEQLDKRPLITCILIGIIRMGLLFASLILPAVLAIKFGNPWLLLLYIITAGTGVRICTYLKWYS